MNAFAEKIKGALSARPRSSRVGPIGLHFAQEKMHAVQIRQLASGAFCMCAWASMEYPTTREDALANPVSLRKLVTELLGRGSFRGRKVSTALPPGMSKLTSLTYRPSKETSDGAQLLNLMAGRLEGSIEDYVIDYLPVRGDGNAREKVALVAASRKDDVLSFLNGLSSARLRVEELEVSPAAINRLIGLLPGNDQTRDNVLVINYGADVSYLTLISGRRLLMDKEINFGSNLLIEQVARGVDITTAMAERLIVREGLVQQIERPFGDSATLTEDDLNPLVDIIRPLFSQLAEEVRRACLYAAAESQGDVVERVYTLGTIARWPGADQLLSDIARIPVADTFPLAAIFDGDDNGAMSDYAGIGPDLAVATGLALRGLTDDA